MWAATIDLVLTPGTYTVTDSDSFHVVIERRAGGAGHVLDSGYPPQLTQRYGSLDPDGSAASRREAVPSRVLETRARVKCRLSEG